MNKILLAVLLSLCLKTFGQVNESFSDGDFTNNPIWTPDNAVNWTVLSSQLRSNSATASSSFYLTTPSAKATNAQWEFFVNLQFNTSSLNYVDVYLTSDLADLTNTANNGYFVRIGSTTDEISLYKLASGVASILINGTDGITAFSNNTLRIKVVRDATNLWTLERDATGGTNYTLEGSVTDNSFTTSNFFGIRIAQSTSSFFYKHFFDDIYAGDIVVETDPPLLQSIQVLSSTELKLMFNEKLDVATANTAGNFLVDHDIGNPASAILQADEKSINLIFNTNFSNGIQNQLTVSGIKDLVGNTIASVTQSFLYFVPQPAARNDLVISELFPDPSPQIGLPAYEFVEVFNKSAKPFDLNSWKLSDPSSFATLPSLLLLPGEYLVLTSAGAASSFNGKVIGLTNFPTLNNSGDAIKLTDPTGVEIDSVNYNLTWYQNDDKAVGGWTLERLNPNVDTNEPTNWIASEDLTGGTPGKQNSVFGKNPDSKPPKLLNVSVLDDKNLLFEFDEALNANATELAHYVIDNFSFAGATVINEGTTIQLTSLIPFTNGVDYFITITGIQDLAGNTMADDTKSFRYFVAAPCVFKDILITEIMADPTPVVQLPEAEYIEIYNRSSKPFDLSGWTISDEKSTVKLPSSIILPDQFMVLTSTTNASKFSTYGKVLGVSGFPSLSNDGEPLVLKNVVQEMIDSVFFSTLWYGDDEKKEGGWSFELIDPQNTCGERDNWIASEDEKGGTPGKQNSVLANKPDLTGPKLLAVNAISSHQLSLVFDEKLEKQILVSSFTCLPEIDVISIRFADTSLRNVLIDLKEPLSVRTLYQLKIQNLHDCNGNPIQEEFSTFKFALPEKADPNDLVINEILFNPPTGSVDFIEIYNRSEKFVNLKEWKLANVEDGQIKNEKTITTDNFILPPTGYMAFTSDIDILKNQYPQAPVTNWFNTSLPPFPDDAGSVILIGNDGSNIDSLVYDKSCHSPLIKDVEGVSLERISFAQPTNDPSNWKSATAASGYATPGYINSNARSENELEDNAVEVNPGIILHSGEEFATIQYRFDETGYVANVKIYDQEGHLIKIVANNETLAYEGFFRWDGDNSDGNKARSGYYVVWFEVFSLDGLVKTYRKKIIVSGA